MSTMYSIYYDRLISHTSASFTNLIRTRERIEDHLKIEKIKDYSMLFEESSSGIGGSATNYFTSKRNEKNEKEVHAIFCSTL